MNAVLKYPGAKNRIADWIVQYFPKHDVYLEPFCGSAAVLLNKEPSRLETINDIDGNVVNLFSVLRNPSMADRLCELIELTPWSRTEYEKSRALLPSNNIDKARMYLVRSWQGISGGQRYATGFKHSVSPQGPVCTRAWNNLPDTLVEACKRLKNAQIECCDGIGLIKKFDVPGALIYIDPPYPLNTRKNRLYTHEMNDLDHLKLLKIITECQNANIVISGYSCDLYDLGLAGWYKVTKNTRAEAGQSRTECLWMNFTPERGLMDDAPVDQEYKGGKRSWE